MQSVLEGSGEQNMVFIVFEKAQPSKVLYLLCFRKLRRAKHGIHCVLEGSAEQSMLCPVFSKARPSRNIVFTVFAQAQPSKV